MTFFIISAAAAALSLEQQTQPIFPLEMEFEINAIEPQFERDQELELVVISPKVEAHVSYDKGMDQKMASILKSEKVAEEELEELAPQVEDLSPLAKGPSVQLAQELPPEEKNPYASLPISVLEKQKINAILTTMAENNVFKLLFEKKRLEKLGREINHVHPIRFLGAVFNDPRLVHCMFEIRKSGFKWGGFIDGFNERFLVEVKENNIAAYIPGFAASLNVKQEDLMNYINYKDFEGLVLHLMEKSQQK